MAVVEIHPEPIDGPCYPGRHRCREYGLMLWGGKSKGAVNNVVNLSRDRKPVG